MTANDAENNFEEEAVTKSKYRFKIWNKLENRDLVRFPRPCKGRIPNFVDSNLAAEKLASLDFFKEAKVILANIDAPQDSVRFTTLESGKTLLVPIARHEDGLVTKICPPTDAPIHILKKACKRQGSVYFGQPVNADENVHIDIIVLGSVAVSKEGDRIGKGGGYADLEYAILESIGAVSEDTLIVTTVHDEQIFDTLPANLFQPFDVPVDFIVTPTKVIDVSPRLPRPKGIMWHYISNRRLDQLPFLKKLRDKEIENGNECTLKEEDSEPEARARPYYRPRFIRHRSQFRQPPRDQNHSPTRSRQNSTSRDFNRRTRTFRRRQHHNGAGDTSVTKPQKEQRVNKRDKAVENHVDEDNKENHPQKNFRPGKPRRFIKNRIQVDFSVKVSNIGATVRVRDLKAALIEKGVRPRDITWKGARGFALLHFAKMKAQPEQPTAVDDVIASLQGLKVKAESESEVKEMLLFVEPAKPISRIENAGVTSV